MMDWPIITFIIDWLFKPFTSRILKDLVEITRIEFYKKAGFFK